MIRQVRIQSDGDGTNTVVTTTDGSVIPHVYSLRIDMEANEVNTAHLQVTMPKVDVHAEPTVTFRCPCCNESMTHTCPSR